MDFLVGTGVRLIGSPFYSSCRESFSFDFECGPIQRCDDAHSPDRAFRSGTGRAIVFSIRAELHLSALKPDHGT
jgi:hypothetical protein